jgi:sugar phosphate isomerase/epimerase
VAIGRRIGVEPYLEFWGRAKRLSQLSEAVYVALKSGVPNARLLLDPFHMYIGGSAMNGIGYLQGSAIGIVHVNDYPTSPSRAEISDAERLFPGEGIAPSQEFARLLHAAGYHGYLSLELFISNYGSASALEVAQRGLRAIHRTYRIDE